MKIISESAFNHQGNLDYLKQLAQASQYAGANYFTVQIMNVDAFCVSNYQKYDLYKNTEFSDEQWVELFDYCNSIFIDVIPCVLDEHAFELCNKYGFDLIKIHATDITNKPFLERIVQDSNMKILLETQCATLFEIAFAIEILGIERIEALFSGFSNYPTEAEDLNLDCIDSLKSEFKLEMGYADHTTDVIEIPLMVLAKGCKYLEKHITLSRNDRHLDWQVSLYPDQFRSMVSSLRYYQKVLGNGVKHPCDNERKFREVMYKKVIPNKTILKRADIGSTYIEHQINTFNKDNVIVALIARLKSQRLKNKVLKPLAEKPMIVGFN